MGVPLKYTLISILTLGMLLSASLSTDVSAAQDGEFAALLSEARAAQKKADAVGGEWRDVEKFLKEARQAAANGDFEQATRLARKAKLQSELGYAQAASQKGKAGHPSYLQ